MKRINYLANKHLMGEIASSKLTYAWSLTPAHHQYDVIVRAKPSVPMPGIIRVMTGEHLPFPVAVTAEDGTTVRPPKGTPRPNFPPYKHFEWIGEELTEVARSHWRGDLETGSFSSTHGRITASLARSWMLLVDRYGNKPQFRNYSYLDEMKAQALMGLSEHGLKFDESKGSNPFAYFTTIVHNNFIRVLNSEKKVQNIRDAQIELAGFTPVDQPPDGERGVVMMGVRFVSIVDHFPKKPLEPVSDRTLVVPHVVNVPHLNPSDLDYIALEILQREFGHHVSDEAREWMKVHTPSGRFVAHVVRRDASEPTADVMLMLKFDDPNEALAFRMRWT